jgi:hypothetical protein
LPDARPCARSGQQRTGGELHLAQVCRSLE